VLRDFGFGEVQVHLHALVEQFRRLGGIAEEQLAHHAVGGEFVQVTAADADTTPHGARVTQPTVPTAKCSASRITEPKGIGRICFRKQKFRSFVKNCGTVEI